MNDFNSEIKINNIIRALQIELASSIKSDEDLFKAVAVVTESLNIKFKEGVISEQSIEKSFNVIDDIFKAKSHKYIRREGSPGNYKYIYKESGGKSLKEGNFERGDSVKVGDYVMTVVGYTDDGRLKVKNHQGENFTLSAKWTERVEGQTQPKDSGDLVGKTFNKDGVTYKVTKQGATQSEAVSVTEQSKGKKITVDNKVVSKQGGSDLPKSLKSKLVSTISDIDANERKLPKIKIGVAGEILDNLNSDNPDYGRATQFLRDVSVNGGDKIFKTGLLGGLADEVERSK